jgi:hypothetical protein
LQSLLQDGSRRVRFFAALALTKYATIWTPPAGGPKSEWTAILRSIAQAAITLARENADQDEPLRHAAVMLLAACNSDDVLRAAARDDSSSVRLAALLAMRRLEKAEISQFLADRNPDVVREAARAINDVPISAAYGELGRLIEKHRQDAQLMLRVINANPVGTAGARRWHNWLPTNRPVTCSASGSGHSVVGCRLAGPRGLLSVRSGARPRPAVAAPVCLSRLFDAALLARAAGCRVFGAVASILFAVIRRLQPEIKEVGPAFSSSRHAESPPKARAQSARNARGFGAPPSRMR